MAKKIAYELYNPHLSVRENADNLGCSQASIRKYIRQSQIDRKYDAHFSKWKRVKDYNKENPNATYQEKKSALGMSVNTIRKYEKISVDDLDKSIRDTEKVSYFDIKNINCIKSISYKQDEILMWIMRLYNDSNPFECDLTYSKGIFYKKVPTPKYKYDKYPQLEDVVNLCQADCLADDQFSSIIYDLPFIISDKNSTSIIKERFTFYKSVREAYQANDEMLSRAYRLLKVNGILVVKTMDCLFAGKQYWISDYVMNNALKMGLVLEDKFILLSRWRLLSKTRVQHSARKYHSYFFVFRKV